MWSKENSASGTRKERCASPCDLSDAEWAQVAALSGFLASDDAAPITGAIMPIEGGWTAH